MNSSPLGKAALAMLGGLALAACLSAGGEGGSDAQKAEAQVLKAAPKTVEVALPEAARRQVRRQLERRALQVVRLKVGGLRAREASSLKAVRLFIDLPEATLATPVSDPHYAGNFVLGLEDPQTFLFNVAPTLARIWRAGDLEGKNTLKLTLVPETWENAPGLPESFALSFDTIEIETP